MSAQNTATRNRQSLWLAGGEATLVGAAAIYLQTSGAPQTNAERA